MRAVSWVFAVVGGCALVVAVVGNLMDGDPAGAGWMLIGPAPFYAVGLAGAFRGRGHPVAVWLLAAGSLDMVSQCLGDVVLMHVGFAAAGWVIFAAMCAGNGSQVAGMGLIGLFPTGRPDRKGQRAVLITAAALGVLIPVLVLVASPWMPRDPFGSPDSSAVPSPLFQAAAWPLSDVANVAYQLFILVILAGLIMLYMRYRRSPQSERRQVRLALVGLASGTVVFGALLSLGWIGGEGSGWTATALVLWVIGLVLVLGSLIVALSPEEMLGIDRSARRALVNKAVRAAHRDRHRGRGGCAGSHRQPLRIGGRGDPAGGDGGAGGATGSAQAGAVRRPVGVRCAPGRIRGPHQVRRDAGDLAGTG